MLYVPATFFRPRAAPVRFIVLHTMESLEGANTAELVARWIATQRKSCHYFVDAATTVQGLLESYAGAHAPGVNGCSIGVEHAGRASQGAAGWADPYSVAMLLRSARLVAEACVRHHLPAIRPPVDAIRGDPEAKGIIGHGDASEAFGKSDHTDPGPDFPWGWYLEQVSQRMAA